MNSKYVRISAWLAVVFGAFLVFGETRRNWADWGHPVGSPAVAQLMADIRPTVLAVGDGIFIVDGRKLG